MARRLLLASALLASALLAALATALLARTLLATALLARTLLALLVTETSARGFSDGQRPGRTTEADLPSPRDRKQDHWGSRFAAAALHPHASDYRDARKIPNQRSCQGD
jgi:hypothetical protein